MTLALVEAGLHHHSMHPLMAPTENIENKGKTHVVTTPVQFPCLPGGPGLAWPTPPGKPLPRKPQPVATEVLRVDDGRFEGGRFEGCE